MSVFDDLVAEHNKLVMDAYMAKLNAQDAERRAADSAAECKEWASQRARDVNEIAGLRSHIEVLRQHSRNQEATIRMLRDEITEVTHDRDEIHAQWDEKRNAIDDMIKLSCKECMIKYIMSMLP